MNRLIHSCQDMWHLFCGICLMEMSSATPLFLTPWDSQRKYGVFFLHKPSNFTGRIVTCSFNAVYLRHSQDLDGCPNWQLSYFGHPVFQGDK